MANPKPEPLHQARATYCPNVATPTPAAAMAAPVPITEASTGSSSLQPVLLGVSVLVGEKKKRIKGKKKKKSSPRDGGEKSHQKGISGGDCQGTSAEVMGRQQLSYTSCFQRDS